MRIKKSTMVFSLLLFLMGSMQISFADDAPPSSITSFGIVTGIAEKLFTNWHLQPIGVCFWLTHVGPFPYTAETLEFTEYEPDLVVTVYNEAGDDPWTEARWSIDKVSQTVGSASLHAVTGDALADGHTSGIGSRQHNSATITKSVDVIGSPSNFLHFPMMLQADTRSFMPYYQSALDAAPGRMGFAEALRIETYNPFSHVIGQNFLHHWAYEYPRDMTVTNDNDFKAAVSIALHAADIVTNKNTLHVVRSTHNTCGTHCAVKNVIEETNRDHEIWQEVYPKNHNIQLGESDLTGVTPLGQADIKAGHGNYVFVIWRHYRGCIQHRGKFLFATASAPATQRR